MPKGLKPTPFEENLEWALAAFEEAIVKAESSTDFIKAYVCIPPDIVEGRNFRQVAFDSLMDVYIDMTYTLPIEQIPLEPYRTMMTKRDDGQPTTNEEARDSLRADREDHERDPLIKGVPEMVTIFGDHPRVEIIDVMTKWRAAAKCLSDVLESEESRSIKNRSDRYLARATEAFDRNYEPHLEGMMRIKKDARAGKFNSDELSRLMMRAEDMELPPAVLRRIKDDLKRMDGMQQTSSEYNSVMHPLLTIFDLPWNKKTKLAYSIRETESRMDERHFGLDKIKARVAEHIAVQMRTKTSSGTILCLDGDPGVGKTSLAQTIAYATGRKLVRIALGGTRDVNDIRGHRSTYINAQAGRIINAIIESGSRNPVFLFDEIDKLSGDDVAAALLEVLDPEQNRHFRDSFIDIDFDLSEVMFIASSNDSSRIMPALRDRMEMIYLPSYTASEKFQIATKHLMPKQMAKAGLTSNDMALSPEAIKMMIANYVREPGVRNLERLIEKVCRKTAYQIETGKTQSVLVSDRTLEEFLGKSKLRKSTLRPDAIGVANGLGVTGHTGSTLPFEVVRHPSHNGEFKISQTGQMQDVMEESIELVQEWIKSSVDALGMSWDELNKWHLHIDAPDDCKKDGPSAGIAILCACLSALKQMPLRADIAMTGKMSLTGRVLEIGGTIAKLEGAMKAGITTVLIPEDNAKDLEDASEDIKAALRTIPVATVSDVLKCVFSESRPAPLLQLPFQSVAGNDVADAETPPFQGPKHQPHYPSAPPACTPPS